MSSGPQSKPGKPPRFLPLTIPSASANEQLQSQTADQTTAPVTTSTAPVDTIQQLSRTTTTISTQITKDNGTVTVNSADPLDLGKHRRSNVTQAQMKVDYPQANKKRMKVCNTSIMAVWC